MLFKIVLVLLPALVYGTVNVFINAGDNPYNNAVNYFGTSVDLISDRERQTFGITQEDLKNAARDYSGGRPGDVYVKSPTPWDDLYKSYGWEEVRRTLYPRSARIVGITKNPTIIATREFINNSSRKATFNAGISQSVQETVSSTWTTGGALTVKADFNYGIKLEVASIGAVLSIAYTSSWGESHTKSRSVTVGSSSGVAVELNPGQSIIASLKAFRANMEVEVEYSATLSGLVACNYPNKYKGHHFWGYDINGCLMAAGKPTTVDSKEVINIGFITDATITVSDKHTSQQLAEERAGLV